MITLKYAINNQLYSFYAITHTFIFCDNRYFVGKLISRYSGPHIVHKYMQLEKWLPRIYYILSYEQEHKSVKRRAEDGTFNWFFSLRVV